MKAYTLDNVDFNVLPEMTLDKAIQYVRDNEHNPDFFVTAEVVQERQVPRAEWIISNMLESIYEETEQEEELPEEAEQELQELQELLDKWYDKYLENKVLDIVDILYTYGVK